MITTKDGDKLTVIAIVQARMNSTRFPGKVLKSVYNYNKKQINVLEAVCYRIKSSNLIDDIVVATTDNSSDDPIVQLCIENKIKYVQGSEDDIMKRMVKVIAEINTDIIVDITSDCPLVEPALIDQCINKLIDGGLDYCSNVMKRTWPDGLDVQVYHKKAFVKLYQLESIIKEHSGFNFVLNQESFHCENIEAPEEYNFPNWELTVDYQQDLDLIRILIGFLYTKDTDESFNYIHPLDFSSFDAIKLIKLHPALLKINNFMERDKRSNQEADQMLSEAKDFIIYPT